MHSFTFLIYSDYKIINLVAYILCIWIDTSKQGDALVLGFNWTAMYNQTGIDTWKGPSWATMLVMDTRMMDAGTGLKMLYRP